MSKLRFCQSYLRGTGLFLGAIKEIIKNLVQFPRMTRKNLSTFRSSPPTLNDLIDSTDTWWKNSLVFKRKGLVKYFSQKFKTVQHLFHHTGTSSGLITSYILNNFLCHSKSTKSLLLFLVILCNNFIIF